MFPAARIGDPVTHDTVAPSGLIGPPLVPPPTMKPVVIEGLPAAYVTCTAICSGATSAGPAHPPPAPGVPPVPIILGTPTVFINGQPAARWVPSGDTTACGSFLGDPKLAATRTVLIGMGTGARTDLGMNVDILVSLSPTLSEAINALQQNGWSIEYGKAAGGSFANRDQQIITVDVAEQGQATALAQTVAHEVGHAKYALDPYVPPSGLTRAQYIQQNTERHLDDEGAANFMNARARQEILNNGSQDIGIAGTQQAQYEQIYKDHTAGNIDERAASHQMGQLFGNGETTSTTGDTYNTYYGKDYADHWDNNYQGVRPGDRAP
jgi:uncharacterized Zn-binding protein involved in type VI secretion